MQYSEKLQDPKWQKKRLRVFDRDKWKCVQCGRKNVSLHVHHKKYHKSGDPWKTNIRSLETLCRICHEAEKNNGVLEIQGVWNGNNLYPKHILKCRFYQKHKIKIPCFSLRPLNNCANAMAWHTRLLSITCWEEYA